MYSSASHEKLHAISRLILLTLMFLEKKKVFLPTRSLINQLRKRKEHVFDQRCLVLHSTRNLFNIYTIILLQLSIYSLECMLLAAPRRPSLGQSSPSRTQSFDHNLNHAYHLHLSHATSYSRIGCTCRLWNRLLHRSLEPLLYVMTHVHLLPYCLDSLN